MACARRLLMLLYLLPVSLAWRPKTVFHLHKPPSWARRSCESPWQLFPSPLRCSSSRPLCLGLPPVRVAHHTQTTLVLFPSLSAGSPRPQPHQVWDIRELGREAERRGGCSSIKKPYWALAREDRLEGPSHCCVPSSLASRKLCTTQTVSLQGRARQKPNGHACSKHSECRSRCCVLSISGSELTCRPMTIFLQCQPWRKVSRRPGRGREGRGRGQGGRRAPGSGSVSPAQREPLHQRQRVPEQVLPRSDRGQPPPLRPPERDPGSVPALGECPRCPGGGAARSPGLAVGPAPSERDSPNPRRVPFQERLSSAVWTLASASASLSRKARMRPPKRKQVTGRSLGVSAGNRCPRLGKGHLMRGWVVNPPHQVPGLPVTGKLILEEEPVRTREKLSLDLVPAFRWELSLRGSRRSFWAVKTCRCQTRPSCRSSELRRPLCGCNLPSWVCYPFSRSRRNWDCLARVALSPRTVLSFDKRHLGALRRADTRSCPPRADGAPTEQAPAAQARVWRGRLAGVARWGTWHPPVCKRQSARRRGSLLPEGGAEGSGSLAGTEASARTVVPLHDRHLGALFAAETRDFRTASSPGDCLSPTSGPPAKRFQRSVSEAGVWQSTVRHTFAGQDVRLRLGSERTSRVHTIRFLCRVCLVEEASRPYPPALVS
ncbi:leucine-rich colipase-like protein 1 [Leopardus geoffroyi]|uniref:leucine-rich colipase-like protein 1 n=1 Tax=Leopardus geoffroyi TaxID=46844 RepID=UPI001E264BBD|nr:leucine-rich colipase-like protein 1 [Leopardus geoffroyi]